MTIRNWNLKLTLPQQAIEKAIWTAWSNTIRDFQRWLEGDLVNAMVYGGMGIQGIAETDFYRFISSPDGLSELGIENTEPPKLLEAYKNSMRVNYDSKSFSLQFGDMAVLKAATPHPAAGTGHLHIESWLEWIVDHKQVKSGFVERDDLPDRVAESIRIRTAPGGLMLHRGQFGSKGIWRFPKRLADFEHYWFRKNIKQIKKLVNERALTLFNRYV